MEPANTLENSVRIDTRSDFEVLFRTHYSSLCSYANSFLRDVDASEEVVQEVMFKMWTNRKTLVIDTSMKSYLFRAVRNGCMNVMKHIKVRDEYRSWREHAGEESQRAAEDELIATELEVKIRQAIDQLPIERRKIFIMSRYDGLTYSQIAEKLGISAKTVENQMGKALKTLREELAEYLPWMVLFFYDVFRN
jgi:RNA polymerase sigma-70 factor, ECF subfamily